MLELLPDAQIKAHLDSIEATVRWLEANEQPDIIFMDIHLADGSAFDLLKRVHISSPIIFTTAFDQYALEAFKTASIDYLLKPVKKEDLKLALGKLRQFKDFFAQGAPTAARAPQEYKKRFMIRFGEHIKTILTTDIAYCYSESKATFARCFDGKNYPMDHNLDSLEHLLDPQDFFRINRQYLVSLKAIEEMRAYSKARVIIKLTPACKEQPVVSSERAADFKNWLSGEISRPS